MIAKVEDHHRQRAAYVYVRQSTMSQVRHHQESTERQYALKDRALDLGWSETKIRILDRDLGVSGAQMSGREDFKTLVADVSMGQVGAVISLEASRLARSCADWHRLIEICSLTRTVIIDEDGCYDPADFNDGLVLGLKGTMSQAELHFLRARLQGGKVNKAKRGELRSPLPVGLCYGDEGKTVLDPDEEVRGAVRLLFDLFAETGSAYAVVHRFANLGLRFPKRVYGGTWNGKLLWGHLNHGRVRGVLKNPAYAGAYVYGRYRQAKEILPDGQIGSRRRLMPTSEWRVIIPDHHEGYITWEQYLHNQAQVARNQTNGEQNVLSGPAREGLSLLQGLLLCGACGRRVSVRYKGNGGLYPTYECSALMRNGLAQKPCVRVRCELLDVPITRRVLEALQPVQFDLALEAVRQLEQRDEAVLKQWRMSLEKAEYEAQLAQRRYEEVDPSNRLVAATLEKRWNDALVKLEELRHQYEKSVVTQGRAVTPEQKARVLSLAQDLPRLWHAPTTQARDRKRMLRLLVKDITVDKTAEAKQLVLHIRWLGGARENMPITLPPTIWDQWRYPSEVVNKVRDLARKSSDREIAAKFNEEGRTSAKGRPFTVSMIRAIRHKHVIPAAQERHPEELSVKEVAKSFGVSTNVIYNWINRGQIQARKVNSRHWVTISMDKQRELEDAVRNSSRTERNST